MFSFFVKTFLGMIVAASSAHALDCRFYDSGRLVDGLLAFRNGTCFQGNGYTNATWDSLQITRTADETTYLCSKNKYAHSSYAGSIRARIRNDGQGVLEGFGNGKWQHTDDIRCGL